MPKRYKVTQHYQTYTEKVVEAENEDEAKMIAECIMPDPEELADNRMPLEMDHDVEYTKWDELTPITKDDQRWIDQTAKQRQQTYVNY